jgi:signal transduction histidine kinase
MLRLILTLGITTFTVVSFLLFATLQWLKREQESELIALTERAALAVDLQFEIWKTALFGVANSNSLVRSFDLEILRWEADRIAKPLGGWAVLLDSDLATQIFNTWPGASYPFVQDEPIPEIQKAVQLSRDSGRPVVADIFVGKQSNRHILAVVQAAEASNGEGYVMVLAFDAEQLSSTNTLATLQEGSFISVADSSGRIVARSSHLDQFFFRPLPKWYIEAVINDPIETFSVVRGPGVAGTEAKSYLFIHNRLNASPGWTLAIGVPDDQLRFASLQLLFPIIGGIIAFLLVAALEYFRIRAAQKEEQLEHARDQSAREFLLRAELEDALASEKETLEARRNMLGVLGHEMRTPVLSALAALQLVPSEARAQDTQNYLALAEKGLKALQSLIQDILDMSLLNAGDFRLEHKPFDLPVLLADTRDIMSPMAERHKLALQADWPQSSMQVMGDSKRIRQILINLLTNAIKYTREGSVTFRGRWHSEPQGRCYIELCIIDTGPGIPEDKITDVFEPFNRLQQSRSAGISGLGLGLAITKRLAEAMGGEVVLKSSVGVGSSFCLRITLEPVTDTKKATQDASPQEAIHHTDGRVILIVEDNPLQAALLSRMLTDMNATVSIATTGQEALSAAQEKKFDVILIDLGLPDMTGVELAKHLKNAESLAVHVALSANPRSLQEDQKAFFDQIETKTGDRRAVAAMISRSMALVRG